MQYEQSHRKNNMPGSKQGARKQPSLTPTIYSTSDDRRVRTPSKTCTCISKTNLLPSKFDKASCRPLPPLEGTVLTVQRNDSRQSFKPAKSSNSGCHSSFPVKGQHPLIVPASNTGINLTKVHTIADCEMLCTESKHSATVDSAKNTSKNNKLPTQLQRSRSVSRLSSSSSGSSSARSCKSSYSPLESSDTRQSRPATPRNGGQQAAVEKSAHKITIDQKSDGTYSASDKCQRTMAQTSRRRSSSVSSFARVSLQEMNQILTSTPLSLGKDTRVTDADVSGVLEGKQQRSFGVEHSSKAPNKDGKAKSQNANKQSPSDDQYVQSTEQNAAECSNILEQDPTVDHLHKQKPLEKSSSNHGILGGKCDDEVSEQLKSSVSVEWMGSMCESRQNSVVCADYLFHLLIFQFFQLHVMPYSCGMCNICDHLSLSLTTVNR